MYRVFYQKNNLTYGPIIGGQVIGYLNVKDAITGKNTIIIDKDKSFLIKKAFQDYSTGNYSLKDIADMLTKEGLHDGIRKNRIVHKSHVHKILKNPFYCGSMVSKGKKYKHKYENIIDEYLYNKCYEIMEGHKKKPFKYSNKAFIFRGLIRCHYCGCSISSDRKKDKYTYLYCSKYRGNCDSIRIREEVIIEQIKEVFSQLKIPDEILDAIKINLQDSIESKKRYHVEKIQKFRKEYDSMQQKLDILLEMRLTESITSNEYDKKAYELKQRQIELDGLLHAHTLADEDFTITLNYLMDIASKAYELFESSKVEQKRHLINFVLTNLQLKGKKLMFTVNKPFDLFLNLADRSEWRPREDSNLWPQD